MNVERGEVWLAQLDPVTGSEQAGVRPVVIFQNNDIGRFTTTVIAIPLTSNLRRASLPSGVQIDAGDGGLQVDSVALCHQLRSLDKVRLRLRLGRLDDATMIEIEDTVLFTLGISDGHFERRGLHDTASRFGPIELSAAHSPADASGGQSRCGRDGVVVAGAVGE